MNWQCQTLANLNFEQIMELLSKINQKFRSCREKSTKKLGTAEIKKERFKAICSSFAVLASQSVERENKNSNVDNFLPESDIANSWPF